MSIKISILGHSGAGKSTLITRFAKGEFKELDDEKREFHITTNRGIVSFKINYQTKENIDNNILRESNGIIIIFDVTKATSFNEVCYYVQYAMEVCPGKPIVLLANKYEANIEKKVSHTQTLRLLQKCRNSGCNIKHYKISCLNNFNIEKPWIYFAKQHFNDDNTHYVEGIPLIPPEVTVLPGI